MRFYALVLSCAVVLLISNLAKADITLETGNYKFNYDTGGTDGGFEFSYGPASGRLNALEDIDVWVRYRLSADGTNPASDYEYRQLSANDTPSNPTLVTYDPVSIQIGDSTSLGFINPTIDFSLTEPADGGADLSFAFTIQFPTQLGDAKIDLDGFVLFDYAGSGTESLEHFPTDDVYRISSTGNDAVLNSVPGGDVVGFDVFDRNTTPIVNNDNLFDSSDDTSPATFGDLAFGQAFNFGADLPTTAGQTITRNSALVSVPEPSTAALLGVCLIGFGFRRRKV